MNSIKSKEWAVWGTAAIIGFVVFMLLEIVPSIVSVNSHEYGGKAIPKATAEMKASAFAEEQLGITTTKAHAVHQSDKLLTGYLSKEKLTPDYEKKYDKTFPADTFQVNLDFSEGNGYGFVYIHMFTGDITGWNFIVDNTALSTEETQALVKSQLLSSGLAEAEWSETALNAEGEIRGTVDGITIGDASLIVKAKAATVNGNEVLVEYKPFFEAPDSYLSYVKKQDKFAGWLTGVGYGLMSFVLGVLAIIYAILYRKHTSFTYGIVLTIIFLIAYIIMNMGVMDGVIASQGEVRMDNIMAIGMAILTIIMSVVMAVSVYFSLVAGDGLWKAQGRDPWPRLKSPGYGDYVWRSMGLSYLFAFIMLGLQPIIFKALELLIGTWGASDVTMSPYNMKYLWLMPALAWAAAISEEAVFRFFGIGLFRRWFRHTFAAAILPTLFWALGHVMYPFYPSTTRLFELMIIGLIFSFIFVRYGLITAMFTHAIFNTVAVGSSLVLVGGAANITSAVIFILLPVIIALILKAWSTTKKTSPPTMSTPRP